MDYRQVMDDIKRRTIIVFSITFYPLLVLYSYFVFVGIFILEQTRFNTTRSLIEFISYNLIVIYTIIFYIRIYPIEDISTKDLFYPMFNETNIQNVNFNMFFVDRIDKMISSHRIVCGKCGVLKPPRAHHCRRCNRCFLKMDHHCALVNECVGWHNYKFFVVFLLFNTILSIFLITILGIQLFNSIESKFFVNYIICIVFFTVNFLFTSILFCYHIFLIIHNETTVENIAINEFVNNIPMNPRNSVFQEGILARANQDALDSTTIYSRDTINPYDVGMWENIKEVFGDNVLYWFLPVFSSRGNGIDFPKNIKNEDEELFADIT